MDCWWYEHFLHFDLYEIIAFASYLPVTPALPVISESGPLPVGYSNLFRIGLVMLSFEEIKKVMTN